MRFCKLSHKSFQTVQYLRHYYVKVFWFLNYNCSVHMSYDVWPDLFEWENQLCKILRERRSKQYLGTFWPVL